MVIRDSITENRSSSISRDTRETRKPYTPISKADHLYLIFWCNSNLFKHEIVPAEIHAILLNYLSKTDIRDILSDRVS